MTGEEQAVAERRDLVVGDLGARALRLDEVGDQAVATLLVGLHDEPLALLPVLDEIVRVRDLLLVVEVAPRHGAAGVRPALVGRHHRGVDAEEGEDRDRRDVVRDVHQEVALTVGVGEHALQRGTGVLADRRLEGLEAARGEGALRDGADAGVVGRDAGRQAGVGGEAALLHDAGRFGTALADRGLGVLAREGLPVVEHGTHIRPARHDPQADALVVHHGLLLAETLVRRERVGHVERLVAVVRGAGEGGVVDRAACGGRGIRHGWGERLVQVGAGCGHDDSFVLRRCRNAAVGGGTALGGSAI